MPVWTLGMGGVELEIGDWRLNGADSNPYWQVSMYVCMYVCGGQVG